MILEGTIEQISRELCLIGKIFLMEKINQLLATHHPVHELLLRAYMLVLEGDQFLTQRLEKSIHSIPLFMQPRSVDRRG